MISLTFGSLAVSAIPYLVYITGITFGKKQEDVAIPDQLPPITVVFSAYNEESNIRRRIKNIKDCAYPSVEVIAVDDCSTDKTLEELLKCVDEYGISSRIIANSRREGVSASYNKAIQSATTDVVVLTDADVVFSDDALRKLISRLVSDEKIGAVSGDLQPLPRDGDTTAMETNYRSVYGKMCEWESAHDSTLNFNGAIMAFRKSAATGIDTEGADDANTAFAVIRNGYRAVYEKAAVAYEVVPDTIRVQYRQKVRRASGLLKSMWNNTGIDIKGRPFIWFYVMRVWMYFISPLLFLLSAILNPVILVLSVLAMITAFGRTFVLNQVYLFMGLVNMNKDVKTWQSISSTK